MYCFLLGIFSDFIVECQPCVKQSSVSTMKITYSSNYLKSLNKNCYPINPELRNELNRLQTFTKKTKRGCHGGRHKQWQITVVNGNCPPGKGQLPRPPYWLRHLSLKNCPMYNLLIQELKIPPLQYLGFSLPIPGLP